MKLTKARLKALQEAGDGESLFFHYAPTVRWLEEQGLIDDYSRVTEKGREVLEEFKDKSTTTQPADQQRQPADADLTPDEVATLRLTETGIWCANDSEYKGIFESLEQKGYVRALNVQDANGTAYITTPDGRAHLAALTSAPADVPTTAADTIADMLVREIDDPFTGKRQQVYPFLKPDAKPFEIATAGMLYADTDEPAIVCNMQLSRLTIDETQRLIAALQYALSTLTD